MIENAKPEAEQQAVIQGLNESRNSQSKVHNRDQAGSLPNRQSDGIISPVDKKRKEFENNDFSSAEKDPIICFMWALKRRTVLKTFQKNLRKQLNSVTNPKEVTHLPLRRMTQLPRNL